MRLVVGTRGKVAMQTELILRFGYGAVVPWVTRLENGALRAIAGPDMVVLRTPVHLRGKDMTTVGEFTVEPRRDHSVRADLFALASADAAGARSDGGAGRNREISGANGRQNAGRPANGPRRCGAR